MVTHLSPGPGSTPPAQRGSVNSFGAGLVVLGAGRGSAELIDLLDDLPPSARPGSIVVLDDRWSSGGALPAVCGVAVVGPLDRVHDHVARGFRVLSGIAGSTAVQHDGQRRLGTRADLPERLGLTSAMFATFVHPQASVSRRASVGAGVIAYPGAQVHVDACVGDQVLLYPNSVVHHDVSIGAGAILCAGVMLAGHVRIGRGSYLGVGTAVRERVAVGAGCLVGMGSVVVTDVADGAVVYGVPAHG